jgi:hypothetical protein
MYEARITRPSLPSTRAIVANEDFCKQADVWTLRRPRGRVVAYFSARGATKEAIEQVAWQDHEDIGEEDYP